MYPQDHEKEQNQPWNYPFPPPPPLVVESTEPKGLFGFIITSFSRIFDWLGLGGITKIFTRASFLFFHYDNFAAALIIVWSIGLIIVSTVFIEYNLYKNFS